MSSASPTTGAAPPDRGRAESAANLLADLRWTAVELPRLARAARVDLIHHPLPAHSPFAPAPQVVTVHDLAFLTLPGMFDRRFALWAAPAHRLAARRADAVICVSQATRTELRDHFGIDGIVAPHGPGQAPAVPPPRSAAVHFLYVGDDEPRKDFRPSAPPTPPSATARRRWSSSGGLPTRSHEPAWRSSTPGRSPSSIPPGPRASA